MIKFLSRKPKIPSWHSAAPILIIGVTILIGVCVYRDPYYLGKDINSLANVITLGSTLIIALASYNMWAANEKILKQNQHTERAYLSGGGSISLSSPLYTTRTFILDIANNGKTPAYLRKFAIEVCDENELPTLPKYLDENYKGFISRDDRIPPGSSKNLDEGNRKFPAAMKKPIIYGRFWYYDIWHKEHVFSFILSVKPDGNTRADMTTAHTEYSKWD